MLKLLSEACDLHVVKGQVYCGIYGRENCPIEHEKDKGSVSLKCFKPRVRWLDGIKKEASSRDQKYGKPVRLLYSELKG